MAVLLVLAAGLFPACAEKRAPAPDTQIRQQLQQTGARLNALEARIARLETQLTGQRTRIEALERNNALHTAQIRALSDARHSHSTAATPPTRPHPATPTSRPAPHPAPASPPNPTDAAQREAEKNAYTAAWLALKGGRFDEAQQGFEALLHDYPQGEYADQAWFWLGESHAARKRPAKAAQAFRQVVEHYPKSIKRAAALLRLGDMLRMLGRSRQAKARYEQLLKTYPDAPVAEQARRALRRLEQAREPSPKSGKAGGHP